MRKTLKMLLAVTLLAAAAGCGSDTDAEPSPSQSGANHAEASETKSTDAATSKNEAEGQPTTTGKDAPGVVRSTPSGQPYVPATNERPASGVPVPKISDDTRKNSAAGRLATIEYYFAASDYLYETGGAAPMNFIVHPNCADCFKVFEEIIEHYKAGGWLIPGQYEVNSAAATQKKNEEVHQVYEVRVQTKEYYSKLGGVSTGKDGKQRIPGTLRGEQVEGAGMIKDWVFLVVFDEQDRQNYLIGWLVEESEPFEDESQPEDGNQIA